MGFLLVTRGRFAARSGETLYTLAQHCVAVKFRWLMEEPCHIVSP